MPRKARILTAAAADMRMGGGNCEIITSGGSGNQGIGVTLPIMIVAKELDIDEGKMVRAAFFGNIVNCYIKAFAGKIIRNMWLCYWCWNWCHCRNYMDVRWN